MNTKHGLRIGIALFVLAAMFTLGGCDASGLFGGGGDDGGDTVEGTVTASAEGEVSFSYNTNAAMSHVSDTCSVTSDLPAPNDAFTLSVGGDRKVISGLTGGQVVTWEAAIEKGSLNDAFIWENQVSLSSR
jgi:hypothetical protein